MGLRPRWWDSSNDVQRSLRTRLTDHALIVGFGVALVPLLVLLVLQVGWLRELDETSAVAHRAALRSWAEASGNAVEQFYRTTAERLLNVPVALLPSQDLDRIGKFWSGKSREGVKTLFVIDFVDSPTGSFYMFSEKEQRLVSSPASEESLAIILATLPWQGWARNAGATVENLGLQANENDPNHRLVLRPVVGNDERVQGVVGFVPDRNYLAQTLLPRVTRETASEFFGEDVQADLRVVTRDGNGKVVFGTAPEGTVDASVRIPFLFHDHRIGVRSEGYTRERWLGGRFVFNMTLGLLSAAMLIAGLALALYSARRSLRLSQMKSDFVSNVSHELRTPLASIRLFSELLRSGRVKSSERVVEYGDHIEAETRRLSRLIDNILDFSRIESERKEYHPEPTYVLDLVRPALRAFDVRIEQGGFELVTRFPDAPGPIAALDADAVGQVLHNLLDNALKYSKASGGTIEVTVEERDGSVVISIRDEGVGIAAADQRKVFDRFHRVSTGLVHDVKGSGLGLAIVDHVVKSHGGRVTLTSALGEGSTFAIHLPLWSADDEEALDG